MIDARARALVVMGKLPRAGRVKTRLAEAIGAEAAAALYRAFLADVFALVDVARAALPEAGAIYSVALADDEPLEEARALAPPGWRVVPQRSGDLGARMHGAYLDAGAAQVVIVGSDSPAMPPERLLEAFAALEGGADRAVLGPSIDGGYYLVALARAAPRLFEEIAWSTGGVLETSRARAREAGLSLVELAPGYDVDALDDLRRLAAEVAPPESPAIHSRAALLRLAPLLSRD